MAHFKAKFYSITLPLPPPIMFTQLNFLAGVTTITTFFNWRKQQYKAAVVSSCKRTSRELHLKRELNRTETLPLDKVPLHIYDSLAKEAAAAAAAALDIDLI